MSNFPLLFAKKTKERQIQKSEPGICNQKGKWKRGVAVGMERILSGASASRLSFQSSLVLMYPQELASHLAPTSTSTQALALASAFSNGGRSGVRESGGKSNRERERVTAPQEISFKLPGNACVYILFIYPHILFFIYLPQF